MNEESRGAVDEEPKPSGRAARRHQAALPPKTSAALAMAIAAVLAALALGTAHGNLLWARLAWVGMLGVMAYRVFVTGRIGRWRSTAFIILSLAFIVHFKARLVGLTGSAFVAPEIQEVTTCHIAIASSFLNTLYQQYIAVVSGSWRQWSPLTWGALWVAVTLVLGQAWCSWACVYGGLDSGFARLSRRPVHKRWVLRPSLRDLPAGILVAMLLVSLLTLKPAFCLWVCPLKIGTGFLDPNTVTRLIQLAIFATVGIVALVILPVLTRKRVFCGLLCPFGAWQAFFGRINPYRVVIDAERCTHCNLCVKVCPTFAVESGPAVPGVTPYCNRCGECMDACPAKAIDYAVVGQKRLRLPARWPRVLFLSSAWLVIGAVSLQIVPEALLKLCGLFR